MKSREIKETISKGFLLNLLEPFHPTLKPGEKITDLTFETSEKDPLESIDIYYTIVKGGVNNSKS